MYSLQSSGNLKEKLIRGDTDDEDIDNCILHLVYRKDGIVNLEFITLVAQNREVANVSLSVHVLCMSIGMCVCVVCLCVYVLHVCVWVCVCSFLCSSIELFQVSYHLYIASYLTNIIRQRGKIFCT